MTELKLKHHPALRAIPSPLHPPWQWILSKKIDGYTVRKVDCESIMTRVAKTPDFVESRHIPQPDPLLNPHGIEFGK